MPTKPRLPRAPKRLTEKHLAITTADGVKVYFDRRFSVDSHFTGRVGMIRFSMWRTSANAAWRVAMWLQWHADARKSITRNAKGLSRPDALATIDLFVSEFRAEARQKGWKF